MTCSDANIIYRKYFPNGSKVDYYDASKEPGHIRSAGDKQIDKANALRGKLYDSKLNNEERREIQNAINFFQETARYKNLID